MIGSESEYHEEAIERFRSLCAVCHFFPHPLSSTWHALKVDFDREGNSSQTLTTAKGHCFISASSILQTQLAPLIPW